MGFFGWMAGGAWALAPDQVVVRVDGVGPDAEDAWAEPIERAVAALPGVHGIRTTVDARQVTVALTLDPAADGVAVGAAARDAVSAAPLPTDAWPEVEVVRGGDVQRAIRLTGPGADPAWDHLQTALASVPGVRPGLDVCGWRPERWVVAVDPARADAAGISVRRVIEALADRTTGQPTPSAALDPRTVAVAGVALVDLATISLQRAPTGCTSADGVLVGFRVDPRLARDVDAWLTATPLPADAKLESLGAVHPVLVAPPISAFEGRPVVTRGLAVSELWVDDAEAVAAEARRLAGVDWAQTGTEPTLVVTGADRAAVDQAAEALLQALRAAPRVSAAWRSDAPESVPTLTTERSVGYLGPREVVVTLSAAEPVADTVLPLPSLRSERALLRVDGQPALELRVAGRVGPNALLKAVRDVVLPAGVAVIAP